ncbi:MAG: hypothetical protein JKY33_10190 [Bacteroidia bacterium]|nr:hypothetical protein [Bacteroidia bacterium]
MSSVNIHKELLGWDKARNIAITIQLLSENCSKEEIEDLYTKDSTVKISLINDWRKHKGSINVSLN